MYQQIIQIITDNIINFTEQSLTLLVKIVQLFIQDFQSNSKQLQDRLLFFETIIQINYSELSSASSLIETTIGRKIVEESTECGRIPADELFDKLFDAKNKKN